MDSVLFGANNVKNISKIPLQFSKLRPFEMLKVNIMKSNIFKKKILFIKIVR